MKNIRYFEISPTMRCNFGCSYCLNGSAARVGSELSAETWARFLNSLAFGDLPLTIGGGEPSQYPELRALLFILRKEIKVDLLTNLAFDLRDFTLSTSPERFSVRPGDASYKSIRISFHPRRSNPEGLALRAKRLQDSGFRVGIFGINHPDNLSANIHMAELCRQNGVYFFIKDFLGEYDGQRSGIYRYPDALSGTQKTVNCRSKEILIAPDGTVFPCHHFFYERRNPSGTIWDFDPDPKFRICKEFGLCHYCDVKLKVDREFNPYCSVEIE